MTTRKHEIEESQRYEPNACPWCMEEEADSICDRCSRPVCLECSETAEQGNLCPDCLEAVKK